MRLNATGCFHGFTVASFEGDAVAFNAVRLFAPSIGEIFGY